MYRLSGSEGTSTSSVLGETQGSSPLERWDGPGSWGPPKETQLGGHRLPSPCLARVTVGICGFLFRALLSL